jgi:hypothetical protein
MPGGLVQINTKQAAAASGADTNVISSRGAGKQPIFRGERRQLEAHMLAEQHATLACPHQGC